MSHTGYIVPSDLLVATPPRDAWHAQTIPADPTKSLLVVEWDNPNFEVEFESLPDVLPIGRPWEAVSDEVAAALSSLQDSSAVDASASAALPATDVPTVPPAPQTVGSALKQLAWPGARLIR